MGSELGVQTTKVVGRTRQVSGLPTSYNGRKKTATKGKKVCGNLAAQRSPTERRVLKSHQKVALP